MRVLIAAARRKILIGTVVALAAVAVVPFAPASAPAHFTQEVDQTFLASLTSAVCGFPVFVTQRGMAKVTLWYGPDGTTVVRELDWGPGFRTTLFAPTQGTSFSYPTGGTLRTSYPEGTDLGDPAIATFTGFTRKIGSDPAEGGRVVMSAVVVFGSRMIGT